MSDQSLDLYTITDDTKEPQSCLAKWFSQPYCGICGIRLPSMKSATTGVLVCHKGHVNRLNETR